MKSTSSGVLVIVVLILVIVGFNNTYLSKFPEFDGVTNVHHFHGAMMMTWFSLLIAQPFLIARKQLDLHRLLGKISYVVAPIVVYSIFLASKDEYYRDLADYTHERAIAGLSLDFCFMTGFIVLYLLAIINKRDMAVHMRYMICTAILIAIPGVDRIGLGMPFTLSFTFVLPIALIIFDKIKGNPITPYVVLLFLFIGIFVTMSNNMSFWWQAIGGKIAEWLL